ncbi:hypothetical protein [Longitalea luteola]|uniref:hypothetical protein n=1 Tax=Longitalea luteola TaxID=2812563 RepID=UPI001A9628B9|nr:hypothetical protein [Longitalea luteola]
MLSAIQSVFHFNNYVLFTRPFELNIVGVRANTTTPNRFDDQIHVFFQNPQGQTIHLSYEATTDPGTYWLRNPLNLQGTAILAQGQYRDCYQIGLHRGQYAALVQKRKVTVLRDYDRDALLDFRNGKPDTGMHGINIHKTSGSGKALHIDKNSAGCQVFADAKKFSEFMRLCELHRKLYGNSFTYSLIDSRAIAREQRKKMIAVGIGLGAAFLTYQTMK